jgi:hypothetical protein
VAANACQVGNGSSRAPSVLRTLGRSTRTLRPPRVTLPGWVPWRTALRSGLWRPLGPTSRATSAASMTWSTCRPVPTAKASRPSRAVPASSTTATVTCSGSSSSARSVVAVRWVSFGTAVPFWSGFLADARHLPHGRHQAGTATSTSTETGTTSSGRSPRGHGSRSRAARAPKATACTTGRFCAWTTTTGSWSAATSAPASWPSTAATPLTRCRWPRRNALDGGRALPDQQGPGRTGPPPGPPLALLVPLDHPCHARPRLPGRGGRDPTHPAIPPRWGWSG